MMVATPQTAREGRSQRKIFKFKSKKGSLSEVKRIGRALKKERKECKDFQHIKEGQCGWELARGEELV